MKRIGFTNFRRFADFPEMDFNGVTLLVGGNNSGKSTLVKAILLCADNLKMLQNLKSDYIQHAVPVFRFDGNEWHDVKIKTFGRALNYNAEEHKITFSFKISGFTIGLSVVGEKGSDDATGLISQISIDDDESKNKIFRRLSARCHVSLFEHGRYAKRYCKKFAGRDIHDERNY